MTKVGEITAEIRADTSRLSGDLNSAKSMASSAASDMESRFSSVAGSIGSALKTSVLAVGAAAVGAATVGTKMYMDLESASASAASKAIDVNGKSTAEIQAQYDAVLNHIMDVSGKLGASTVFSPTEVAKTYDVLAAAGVNVANVGENELLPFLNTASATGESLADSTETVLGYINAFGLSMSDSGKVADQLSMAMNGSRLSLSSLNYALTQGGATAAQAGLSISEFAGIAGVLSDQMYTGEQAGAALKTAILALYTPTDKQMEALQKLGISYDQIDPRTHNFIDTLELLKSKGADIGDFANIFTDSSGAIMNAAAGSIDKIRTLTTAISGSEGTTQAIADLKMSTDRLPGAWETAKGAAEGLLTAIGGKLEPAVVSLLNAFSDVTPAVMDFVDALFSGDVGKIGESISNLAGNVKDKLVSAFQFAVNGIKNIDWNAAGQTAGKLLSDGVNAGVGALKSLGKTVAGWFESSGGWQGLGSKVAGLFQQGWLVLQRLGATIAGWINSQGGWEGLGAKVAGLFRQGWEVLQSLGGAIAGWIESQGGWSGLGSKVAGVFQQGWSVLKSLGSEIAGWIESQGGWSGLGSKVASAFQKGWDALKSLGSTIAGWIESQGGWSSLGQKAAGAFGKAWDTLKSLGTTLAGYITSVDWGSIGTKVGNAISAGISTVKSFASGIADNIKSWINEDGPTNLGKTIGNLVAVAVSGMLDLGKWIADSLTLKNGTSSISNALTTMVEWFTLGCKAVVDFALGFVSGLAPLANEIRNTILGGVAGGLDAISNVPLIGGKAAEAAEALRAMQIETVWPESTGGGGGGGGGYTSPSKPYLPTSYTTQTGTVEKMVTRGDFMVNGKFEPPAEAFDPLKRYAISLIGDEYRILDLQTGLYSGYYKKLSDVQAAQERMTKSNIAQYQQMMNTVYTTALPLLFTSTGTLTSAVNNFKGITEDEKKHLSTLLPSLQYSSAALFGSSDAFKNAVITSSTTAAGTEIAAETQGAAIETEAAQQAAGITTDAAKQAQRIIIDGSQTAANALNTAASVAANFTTQAGQAVKIGLTQSGQEIAVIGKVAQQQFTAAGGQWVKETVAGATQAASTTTSAASQAGSTTTSAANQAGSTTTMSANNAASTLQSGASSAASTQTSAAATAGSSIVSSGESFAQKVESASGSIVKSFSSMLEAGWKTMVSKSSTKTGSSSYGASAGNVQTTFNDCMFENFTDTCTGIAVNALKYTPPGSSTPVYINPMTYIESGGVSKYISGSSGSSGGSSGNYATSIGYTLPSVFLAKGALVDQPTLAVVGEAGEEMVLPAPITKALLGMISTGGRSENIVIKPADIYLDGRKVGRVVFEAGKKSMGTSGFSIG